MKEYNLLYKKFKKGTITKEQKKDYLIWLLVQNLWKIKTQTKSGGFKNKGVAIPLFY